MKQGDLSPIVGGLRHAYQDLHQRWEEAGHVWSDDVARRFFETHIEPLEGPTQTALKAMDRLALVLMKAYEACSPEHE